MALSDPNANTAPKAKVRALETADRYGPAQLLAELEESVGDGEVVDLVALYRDPHGDLQLLVTNQDLPQLLEFAAYLRLFADEFVYEQHFEDDEE